jgi:hypothetical protein
MTSHGLPDHGTRARSALRLPAALLSPAAAAVAATGLVLLLPHLGPAPTPRVAFGYTPVARDCAAAAPRNVAPAAFGSADGTRAASSCLEDGGSV